ncbi:MAG TPA: NUDIX hydrolase [Candidatus Komeilibacteria bacterium]|nr:NUDIX hydrolase [Candidatus Komeilibacteria bacterium]
MNHWKKLKETEIFNSGHRSIIRKTFRLPDGEISDFDIKNEGKAAAVLALTSFGQVIAVEQFRPGPEEVLWELPGGACERDETPAKAITRELLEETGYAGDLTFIGAHYHCAYSSRIKYGFVAVNCYQVHPQDLDKNEFAVIKLLTLKEFKKYLKTGKLTDVDIAYMGLNYLHL